MINPLNELSSVYMQNIAEDCGKCSCDGKGCSKCDDKKAKVVLKGSSSVDGGDAAKPGKDKNYVKPMATEEKEESKIGGGNLKKLAARANKRIDADVDGDVDTDDPKSTEMGEFVPSPDGKKKIKTKARFESNIYSNWRGNSQELLEVINGGSYGGAEDDTKNLENQKAKTDNKSNQRITEKSVKNKIRINPPQGMAEAFNELGGVIAEMYEIVEETEEEKKKRELQAKTKEHDDKMAGKIAEADMSGAPSIKDAKPAKTKKTNVKYDPHMKVMAPSVKEGVLSGALSTIRSKNGMGTVTAKGADKLQAKKEKTMGEENKMSAFDMVKKQIKDKYGEKSLIDTKAPKKQPSPEQRKADAQRRAKNYADNNKNYNPYKARAGESD